NSDAGGALYMEVVRAVAHVYGWPDFEPETRTVVKVAPDVLQKYVGEYELAPDAVLAVTLDGGQLYATYPGESRLPLLAESDTTFFPEGSPTRVSFERDAGGSVTQLVLHMGSRDV